MSFNPTHITKHESGIVTFLNEPTHLTRSQYIDFGWGNGYIGVPKGHSLYGKHYDDIYDIVDDVHGGWTFAQEMEIEGVMYWVFGFDTAHYQDNLINWPEERVLREILSVVDSFINYVA